MRLLIEGGSYLRAAFISFGRYRVVSSIKQYWVNSVCARMRVATIVFSEFQVQLYSRVATIQGAASI